MWTAVLIGWYPPTPPPHLESYTRALLVSKDRRHLFVTPWWGLSYDVRLPVEKGEVVRRYPDTRPAQVNTLEPVIHVHAVLNIMFSKYFSNFQILNINNLSSLENITKFEKVNTVWRRPLNKFGENCLRNIRKWRQFSHIFAKISSCFRFLNVYKKGENGILKNLEISWELDILRKCCSRNKQVVTLTDRLSDKK